MTKRKRTPWPRRARVTRNLLLFLLLALTAWTQLEKPLPYGLAVRREARQSLIPEMDHHANISRGIGGGYFRIDWTEGIAMTSAYIPSAARLTYFYTPHVTPCDLTDGPNLLPFPRTATFFITGTWETYAVFAALFPPENGASAVLTLHNNSGTFTVSGQREDEIFIFYARPEPKDDGSRYWDSYWFSLDESTYELTFHDETGKIVSETAG